MCQTVVSSCCICKENLMNPTSDKKDFFLFMWSMFFINKSSSDLNLSVRNGQQMICIWIHEKQRRDKISGISFKVCFYRLSCKEISSRVKEIQSILLYASNVIIHITTGFGWGRGFPHTMCKCQFMVMT